MCDSLVAPASMTRERVTLYGKNSDRGCNEPQYFVHLPPADYPAGAMLRCTYRSIPQTAHTLEAIVSKSSWIWGAEMGVNERGVLCGNEAAYSKETCAEPSLLGMDIVRLVLERSASAREGVQLIGELLEQYGQGGNNGFDYSFYYDNTFLVLDASEIWYVETAGAYWAAKQIMRPYTISNHLMMGEPDLLHAGAAAHAAQMGWTVAEPFDFAAAYMDWEHPNNISGIVRRMSSLRLLEEAGERVDVDAVLGILRCHTTDEKWLHGDKSVCKHTNEHSQSQTTNAMLALIEPGDYTLWGTGCSTPCVSPFQPFWIDAYSDRLVFSLHRQEEAMDAWLKREALNRAAIDGRLPEDEYLAEMHEMERRWFDTVRAAHRADRPALCEQVAAEAGQFVDKWLAIAASRKSAPIGSEAFQAVWRNKNGQLGANRTIAPESTPEHAL